MVLAALDCPAGFEFNEFASSCPADCMNRTQECGNETEPGCQCPIGQLLSGDTCVPEDECGCYVTDESSQNLYYPASAKQCVTTKQKTKK